MSASLQKRVYAREAEDPEARAIGFLDARGALTWRRRNEFLSSATARAAALREHGFRNGDVCVLVLPSDEACATLLLGVLVLAACG